LIFCNPRTQECKIVKALEKPCPNTFKNKETNQKYGTHPERHFPHGPPAGETKSSQDYKKTWLSDMHRLHSKKEKINWNVVTR